MFESVERERIVIVSVTKTFLSRMYIVTARCITLPLAAESILIAVPIIYRGQQCHATNPRTICESRRGFRWVGRRHELTDTINRQLCVVEAKILQKTNK